MSSEAEQIVLTAAVAVAVVVPLVRLLRRDSILLGLLAASVLFDPLAISTPLATLSCRNLLILAILCTRLRDISHAVSQPKAKAFVLSLATVWLSGLVAIAHSSGTAVLRSLVTEGAFAATALIAFTFGNTRQSWRNAGYGAALALSVLATFALLSQYGVLVQRSLTAGRRELLFISSPFERSYGLSVPIDAIVALLPLAIPVLVFERHMRHAAAMRSTLVFIVITLATVLLFQSRGMTLQILVCLAVFAVLRLPRRIRLACLAAGTSTFGLMAVQSLMSVDKLSSGLRAESNRLLLERFLTEPRSLLVGVEQNSIFVEAANNLGYFDAITITEGSNAIHNLLLRYFAAGGLVAFIASSIIFLGPAICMGRRVSIRRDDHGNALAATYAMLILVIMVEPLRANAIGHWIAIGIIWRYWLDDSVDAPRSAEMTNRSETVPPFVQTASTSSGRRHPSPVELTDP